MKNLNVLSILAGALLTVTLARAQTEAPSIFESPRTAQAQPDRRGNRQRTAAINLALFDRTAARQLAAAKKRSPLHRARMRMNLFDNLPLTVAWESARRNRDAGTIVWTGKLDDQPLSHAVFVVGDDGVTGNVSKGDGLIYQVRPTGNGSHTITEIDQKSFPKEAAPKLPRPAERSANDAVFDDDGKTIDVLVAYTAAARQAAGGEAQMLKLIQLGVAETNQGYANSGVVQRIRLVGTGEVNYSESGSLDTDLDRLTESNDGFLDEVHSVRDRAGADIVSLWVEKGDACGIGWQMQDPTRVRAELGFHVVKRECATGYFSFGHEMGHNMGASHAREDDAGGGAFPYAFGYKQVAAAPFFRTVMAYDCKGGCARVNYWSSPEASFNGKPTGSRGGENNALTLNNTARIVANFRQSTQGQAPPPAGGGNFPESDHPYAPDTDRVWSYTVPGNPESITVTFDAKTYVEEDYDYIGIYDASQKLVGEPYTGSELAGKTITLTGATVHIRLVTDESEQFYGFKVTSIAAKGSGSSGGKSDLAAVSFKADATARIGGKVGGVDAKVQNLGTGAAGEFRIGFYWINAAKEAVFSGWSCAVKSLDPGATYTCGGEVGVPASLPAGTYQLAVIADDQKQTADANWDNNARLAEAPVKLQ